MRTQMPLIEVETRLEAEFQAFHAANPHVYDKLVKMTRQAQARGHRQIGISMLFEVLRWESLITTTDTDYKLNNNYRSRYARLIMKLNPDLDGIFELREIKS